MPVARFDLYQEEERWAMMLGTPDGEYVLYEDHLVETARLEHIIAALEGQIKLQAEQIGKMQKFKEVKWHTTEE